MSNDNVRYLFTLEDNPFEDDYQLHMLSTTQDGAVEEFLECNDDDDLPKAVLYKVTIEAVGKVIIPQPKYIVIPIKEKRNENQ
jgi:hypothetical protein